MVGGSRHGGQGVNHAAIYPKALDPGPQGRTELAGELALAG